MIINGKRALAHIQQVHDIQPIVGADNIELVHVLGWTLIAKKGEFKDGDLAVYIEIDSKVPDTDDRFAFLQSKKFKVKTYKLGKFGVVSQGLALPLSLFPELSECQVNDDVTDILHITYAVEEDNARKGPRKSNPNDWVKVIAARHPKFFKSKFGKFLMARKWGRKIVRVIFFFDRPKHNDLDFPSEYCSKTDEERVQNMPYILNDKQPYIVTEKIDGTSTTFVLVKKRKLFGGCTYDFIVSSRNVRQLDPKQVCYHDTNVYWEMAEKYDIKNKMIKMLEDSGGMDYIVLQGETYRFIYDSLENDVMDAYEKYIHEQINEFRMQIKQLEDEVSKEILKEWDFDVSEWNVDKSDDIFRNSGIYFKSEYEYRSDGDREYLWLVKDNDMVLVSIKVYKSPTFDLDNSSATIGFDLYLAREVEVKDE